VSDKLFCGEPGQILRWLLFHFLTIFGLFHRTPPRMRQISPGQTSSELCPSARTAARLIWTVILVLHEYDVIEERINNTKGYSKFPIDTDVELRVWGRRRGPLNLRLYHHLPASIFTVGNHASLVNPVLHLCCCLRGTTLSPSRPYNLLHSPSLWARASLSTIWIAFTLVNAVLVVMSIYKHGVPKGVISEEWRTWIIVVSNAFVMSAIGYNC
jgi:hypothetical protein